MKRIFIVKKNEDFDILGCVEKNAPDNFDPLRGLGVAHDCLEHFPNDTGSIDDEFQAFGAMIWLRNETGFFNNRIISGGIENALPREFVELWDHYKNGVSMKEGNKLKNSQWPINAIIENAKNEIKETFPYLDQFKLKTFLSSAAYFMQLGYNKAKRRYPDNWTTVNVFKYIEEQVDQILSDSGLMEGDEIHIHYTTKKVIRIVHLNQFDLNP